MRLDIKELSLPKKYRIVLFIALPALILLASYFLIFSSQWQETDRLKGEIRKGRQELSKVTAAKNNIEKARKECNQIRADLQDLIRQMPEEKEIPGLLRQVSLTAQETKTKIKYFAPKSPEARELYSELPFEIKYSAPYHSVGYFFDGIRKLERIVQVASFTLDSREVGQKVLLEGTCTAKTYIFQKEPQKEKSDGKKKGEKKDGKNVPAKK
ncbi:MAG: Pilus assembly protein, PilO [Syntrophorhabdaceae bacterium PtaU1.Bin034]|nr:MAG: Pilus assembly protein, PilO [Syntrophorhabdaceae bacterium PtaU1.Bin034]